MTVMVAVPDRSLEQRLSALEEANRIRSRRAELKRDIKARKVSWDVALVRDDCRTMKVFDLLVCVPKIGRVKANRLVVRAQVSPSKTLGGLTDRQRDALLELVGGG